MGWLGGVSGVEQRDTCIRIAGFIDIGNLELVIAIPNVITFLIFQKTIDSLRLLLIKQSPEQYWYHLKQWDGSLQASPYDQLIMMRMI
jgi:hypothetical protein